MRNKARIFLQSILLLSGTLCIHAFGQSFPSKPVTIVVPFAPGGPTDTSARVVVTALAQKTGKTFIVENAPGAGSIIGTAKVAGAEPDGHTLLWGSASALAIAPHLNSNVRYDPNTSFAPITQVAAAPFVLMVNPALNVKSVEELIRLAKSKPGELNYGSTGVGSTAQLVAELFNTTAGIKASHVPYKGGAPMIAALLANEVHFAFDTPTTVVPMVKDNRLVPLAVTSTERWQALPQVKTMDELGFKGFDATTWFGLLAPRGTPAARVKWLNENVALTLKDPQIQQSLGNSGFIVVPSSPQEFAEKIETEGSKWKQTIKAANIRGTQ
ncbi:MAG: Bug family tripartite tricarboxylate transporter substrate binding protein [Noviherbaspirillum sp.]